jgi:hypothetical protein
MACSLAACLGLSSTTVSGSVLVQLGQNFTGSSYGTDSPYVPPDCNGAAGPDHFVELINGRYSVYAKTNGVRLQTMSSFTFWTNSGLVISPGWEVSDPRVVYDPVAARWFASAVDVDLSSTSNYRSNRFLLAISAGADPTGGWQGAGFVADPVTGSFADFPTLGLDANGLYLSAYMFDGTSGAERPLPVRIHVRWHQRGGFGVELVFAPEG